MKKGEQAEFSVRWWKSSQPKGLSSAAKFEQALKTYETALARLKSDGGTDDLKATLAALDGVEGAAKATAAEAGKVRDNVEMAATAQALGKMDFAHERKSAETLVGEDEEGGLADPDTYMVSLRKRLRQLAQGPLNCGFVIGKKAADHRLLLHPSKGAQGLAKKAAGELGLHVFTFGIASASPDRPDTILLNLEGKQLPGLAKKGGRMLHAFKPQPFTKIALFVGGVEVADIDDPEDALEADETETAETGAPEIVRLKAEVDALGDRLRQAIGYAPDRRGPLTAAVAAVLNALKAEDATAARRVLTGVTAEVDRIIAAGPEIGGGKVAYTKLLLDWEKARNAASASLKSLEEAIMKDFDGEPDYDEAKIRVRKLDVIMTTLGGELQDKLDEAMNAPEPSRKPIHFEAQAIIKRYKDYVDSDPFVAAIETNPFQPVNVRSRLSATLATLNAALAA